mmetsp:Transcript_16833/g.34651  ORF Transcript_16833/g.34651 Transcript_16833/m.34651 type:complete len:551 (-) Transcript_16833:942-2594(-)|eukprot:CAMPEP_0201133560 /NCGR_PEP_ID=MMETSP0850-20130426/49190_1 /ASSEMBLY_ACC=CAM_ASM_000622 /TAXON_ID=183588 /ORGANISM="Pseudo-nitzschia fraudulenta, Strain WWA7" /LENGTH=550 /DNA_ID=CAMNT_0047404239 /DNA_START=129 /DNA_END=1781 /DNA_ORIENTATION=-
MKIFSCSIAVLVASKSIYGFSPVSLNTNGRQHRQQSAFSSSSRTALDASSSIVVVSPPGGVGEVAAVRAACLGSSVRWFVISDPDEDDASFSSASSVVTLAPQALRDIAEASGSLELAGATVRDLTKGGENDRLAVSQWCGSANGLICTYDGADDGSSGDAKGFRTALRLAAMEASKGVSGPQVAVLSAEEDLEDIDSNTDEEENGGISNLMGSLLGGNTASVPSTLPRSFSGSRNSDVCVVRHGELFGVPESSPEFSPLIGGPRREPAITEEYTMRTVRVDPFVVSGNVMGSSSQLKSCRHSVGESAALFASQKLSIPASSNSAVRSPTVISISSQAGTDKWTLEQWEEELNRVQGLVDSGRASTLFSSQDMIVEDTDRLANWLSSKWAPAVMKTYDIAAIRIGARPVAAARAGEGRVEITWQELVNFDSVNVGKMILQVNADGITATRGPGDASKGYGSISTLPLNGEDVLVRRLAEAASQAIEKGLAKKVPRKKAVKVAVEAPKPVSSLASAGTVETKPPKQAESSAGPRQAGARRSTPRSRGAKKD